MKFKKYFRIAQGLFNNYKMYNSFSSFSDNENINYTSCNGNYDLLLIALPIPKTTFDKCIPDTSLFDMCENFNKKYMEQLIKEEKKYYLKNCKPRKVSKVEKRNMQLIMAEYLEFEEEGFELDKDTESYTVSDSREEIPKVEQEDIVDEEMEVEV